MKKFLQRLAPRKNCFVGVDIGTHAIKAVEVKVFDDQVEIVSQCSFPAPAGVWTDQFDEEAWLRH